MSEKNYFNRLLVILFVSIVACIGMYWLPDTIAGFSLKKVDILSDMRVRTEIISLDSLQHDTIADNLFLKDSLPPSDSTFVRGLSEAQLLERDSLYQLVSSGIARDTIPVRIEDFSIGRTGLKHFFGILNRINSLDRPVRIAFLGDSFIEGDIILADFRAKMQTRFGGGGVGFVPVSSRVEQHRPTITQRSRGWKTSSILSDKSRKYVLSGMLFEPLENEVSITFKTTNTYPGLNNVTSLKFIYSHNEQSEIRFLSNSLSDTIIDMLPPSDTITQYELEGAFADGAIHFRNAQGLQALGIVYENHTGVVVDNFSLRGNSGAKMADMDMHSCFALHQIRPYDLIILQFGLNVTSEEMQYYGWYRDLMVNVIEHIRQCFPQTDILMLGVSDRSYSRDGVYQTMPAVVSLLRAQYQAAQQANVPFWSIFDAMGGVNAMVRYVDWRWASKDYTHLSFRGGKEIATLLFNALMLEKEVYDEMEK